MKKLLIVVGIAGLVALCALAQGIYGDGSQGANFSSVKIAGTTVIDNTGTWVGGGGSGGAPLNGINVWTGNSNLWNGNIDFNLGVPSVAVGTGAGTGPSISISAGSTDTAGVITLTTGTTPVASTNLLTLTFSRPRAGLFRIFLQPIGTDISNNLLLSSRCVPVGVSSTQWILMQGGTALPASKTVMFAYWCPGI